MIILSHVSLGTKSKLLKRGSKNDPFKHKSAGNSHLSLISFKMAFRHSIASSVSNESKSVSSLSLRLYILGYVNPMVGYFIPLNKQVASSKGSNNSIASLITFHS